MHGFFGKRRAQLRGQRSFILIGLGTTPVRADAWSLWFFCFGGLLAAFILRSADRLRDARGGARPVRRHWVRWASAALPLDAEDR